MNDDSLYVTWSFLDETIDKNLGKLLLGEQNSRLLSSRCFAIFSMMRSNKSSYPLSKTDSTEYDGGLQSKGATITLWFSGWFIFNCINISPPPPPPGGNSIGSCTTSDRTVFKKFPKQGFNGRPKDTINKCSRPTFTTQMGMIVLLTGSPIWVYPRIVLRFHTQTANQGVTYRKRPYFGNELGYSNEVELLELCKMDCHFVTSTTFQALLYFYYEFKVQMHLFLKCNSIQF